MDIINECEYEVMKFSDCELICYNNLIYWAYTYDDVLAGKGHFTFTLSYN